MTDFKIVPLIERMRRMTTCWKTGALIYSPEMDEALAELTAPREAMSEKVVRQMTERFLAWKLPDDFSPDAGISFTPDYNVGTEQPMRHQPTGTNLLDYAQAEQMVRYMLRDFTRIYPDKPDHTIGHVDTDAAPTPDPALQIAREVAIKSVSGRMTDGTPAIFSVEEVMEDGFIGRRIDAEPGKICKPGYIPFSAIDPAHIAGVRAGMAAKEPTDD